MPATPSSQYLFSAIRFLVINKIKGIPPIDQAVIINGIICKLGIRSGALLNKILQSSVNYLTDRQRLA
jgi:hypothetical protein